MAQGCMQNERAFEKILAVEDQRAACQLVLDYLENDEPRVRVRALQAIARLEDSTCVEAVAAMLDDVNHNVRIEAAFALGQIKASTGEAALIERLAVKDLMSVKRRLLEALGKIGSTRSYDVVRSYFTAIEQELRAEAALTVGRFAIRDMRDSSLTQGVTELLEDESVEVRWRAAYTLMKIGRNIDPKYLRDAVKDPDARVRMHALLALGELQDFRFLEVLGRAVACDQDWRVRVKAANALAYFPLSLSSNYLVLLNQKAQPVRVAIIEAIGQGALLEEKRYKANSRELNYAKNQLEAVLDRSNQKKEATSEAEIGAALVAYARLMSNKAYDLIAQYAHTGSNRLKAKAMTALGEIASRKAIALFKDAFHDSTAGVVKIAVLEALAHIPAGHTQLYLQALKENDVVLVALGAQGLAGDLLKNKIYAKQIISAYKRLQGQFDAESAEMIFEAMLKFKVEEATSLLKEALSDRDRGVAYVAQDILRRLSSEDIEPLPKRIQENTEYEYETILELQGTYATIVTDRGNIKVKLLPLDAPLTTMNFIRLVQSRFYDGLNFHRVVPNFVIQGGDPRGDGWGSPGYAIRSEFNKINYERGMVGMASAGKDTEGSQFFITQSVQPHLDGRYTVFGEVVSGMEVVDEIQEGDLITAIEIEN